MNFKIYAIFSKLSNERSSIARYRFYSDRKFARKTFKSFQTRRGGLWFVDSIENTYIYIYISNNLLKQNKKMEKSLTPYDYQPRKIKPSRIDRDLSKPTNRAPIHGGANKANRNLQTKLSTTPFFAPSPRDSNPK